MTPYFVNLPLGYAFQGMYIDLFLEQKVCPELGLEGVDLEDPAVFKRIENMAGRIREAGLVCSVHLPWTGLSMFAHGASLESRLDAASRALEAAQAFNPVRLVAHPDIPSGSLEERRADVGLCAELWRRVAETWPGHPPLALENTFEDDPRTLAALAAEIDRADVGLCFDVGHWRAFARGAVRKNLSVWMETLAPYLSHVHLHDNNGWEDEHLGLGAGGVDWGEFAETLAFAVGPVTAALEPHSLKDYNTTLRYLEGNPMILSRIKPARHIDRP
ncbi:MAG: hypothetical protein PWQ57_417 [Desulfovibrionales bacterium]|nr:hypothetical protein [Desulfovibrionales bacterium]